MTKVFSGFKVFILRTFKLSGTCVQIFIKIIIRTKKEIMIIGPIISVVTYINHIIISISKNQLENQQQYHEFDD